jgi:hypothetical protein
VRQPGDLGPPTVLRTLLFLAERAEGMSAPNGPLQRFANEAASQGGLGCTVELGACKGFRRALNKAQAEYAGDYGMLNDMARCSIICPKFSALAECLRWIIEEAPVRCTRYYARCSSCCSRRHYARYPCARGLCEPKHLPQRPPVPPACLLICRTCSCWMSPTLTTSS